MKFYLELGNNKVSYRLQSDMKWKKIVSKQIGNGDFLTDDPSEVVKLQKKDSKIEIDDTQWNLNPSGTFLGATNDLFYRVFIQRHKTPDSPSKEQLIRIIKEGDDTKHNLLILNAYGKFELKDFDSEDRMISDPLEILCYEVFNAGNDYVGEAASKDNDHIDKLYKYFMNGWLVHMDSGKTNIDVY